MRSLMALAIACCLPALVLAEEPVEGRSYSLHEIVSGVWGWSIDGGRCNENPHTIEFSKDGRTMSLRYARGVDGEPRLEAEYRVIGEGPGFLRMEMKGETRTTESGELVVWDLVLLDANSFCWHRTDWREGGCTEPIERCTVEADT